MKIAILGATSNIAKDLILKFFGSSFDHLFLFARDLGSIKDFVSKNLSKIPNKKYSIYEFEKFNTFKYDVVINFIGVANLKLIKNATASLFEIANFYDDLVISYLKKNNKCIYFFISSGAAYLHDFSIPLNNDSVSNIKTDTNSLSSHDWYSISKFYNECKHRAHNDLHIIDLRLFSYFSRNYDINSNYFIADIIKSIINKKTFITSNVNFYRDFIGPSDFYNMILAFINSPICNLSIDFYSKKPVEKFTILHNFSSSFGLKYEIVENHHNLSPTGLKKYYYSHNKLAQEFGYIPEFNSLDLLINESKYILDELR